MADAAGGGGGVVDDEMAWTRSRAEELAAALPADVLPAFERLLTVLAGPGSTLRRWAELTEETATRIERIDEQSAAQPAGEQAVVESLRAVDRDVRQLGHKARLAATLQDNLEARAKALRKVLREPSLWPCGELSVDETSQHRELIALRDRVDEGERQLQTLTAAIGTRGRRPTGMRGDGEWGGAATAGADGGASHGSPNVLSLDEDDIYVQAGKGRRRCAMRPRS